MNDANLEVIYPISVKIVCAHCEKVFVQESEIYRNEFDYFIPFGWARIVNGLKAAFICSECILKVGEIHVGLKEKIK